MPVGFKINGNPATNINEIFKDLESAAEKTRQRIIMAVRIACLQVVKMARELPSPPETERSHPHQPHYIDKTGILRASIGFVIYDRGARVFENFEKGGEGAQKGLVAANSMAAKFPDKIVACIVAGAEYAAAVESKGYFVLSDPASHLGEILQTYLKQIKF